MHLVRVFLILAGTLFLQSSSFAEERPSQMRTYLQERVLRNPDDAASHRMLGHVLLEEGRIDDAISELKLAIRMDPANAAAIFDLGCALQADGHPEEATEHWRALVEQDPKSPYAVKAAEKLRDMGIDPDGEIKPVRHEVHEFPGPPVAVQPEELPAPDHKAVPVLLHLETGLLFNSNVALAPSSRQLPAGDRQSFQLFASPDLEWWALSSGNWTAGPLFTGYFTFNEDAFRSFNLSSYSPGVFAEYTDESILNAPVVRLEYHFGLDEFSGQKFSQRNSAVGRFTTFQEHGATTSYLAVDHTNFADDGLLPEVTSADGISYATGVAHEFDLEQKFLRQLRIGLDLDRLDAHGSDYAYWGAGVSGQAIIPLVPTVEMTVRAGLGFRIFDRYQFDPDRDELIWRTAGEIRKWLTPDWSVSAIANYQAFDSSNPLFAADRMIAGVTMQYRF